MQCHIRLACAFAGNNWEGTLLSPALHAPGVCLTFLGVSHPFTPFSPNIMAISRQDRRPHGHRDPSPGNSAEESSISSIPQDVLEELRTAYLRIQNPAAAHRIWRRSFTEQDRQHLGNDLEECYPRLGTVGMWRQARGTSAEQAIVEAARSINLMSEVTADWLLREIGEGDAVSTPSTPVWNVQTGELRLEGVVIRRLRVKAHPTNIQQIVDAFEATNWPTRIDNPLHMGNNSFIRLFAP